MNDFFRIPERLDDIIRIHREKVKLEIANEEDLARLRLPLIITNLKGILRSGYIYKWVHLDKGISELFMIGHRVGAPDSQGLHSSRIVGYDPVFNVALTRSGSHYILENFVDSDTDQMLLLHICGWAHNNNLGDYYGVPEWFL